MTEFRCIVCDRPLLRTLPAYERLPRVTSDCKPWPAGGQLAVCDSCGAIQKLPDRKWLDEIDRIYRAYQIYHLSGGEEQVIFSADGQAVPRSRALADFVTRRLDRSRPGRMIDIGCGNGSALANFSRALDGWSFEGVNFGTQRFRSCGQFRASPSSMLGRLIGSKAASISSL